MYVIICDIYSIIYIYWLDLLLPEFIFVYCLLLPNFILKQGHFRTQRLPGHRQSPFTLEKYAVKPESFVCPQVVSAPILTYFIFQSNRPFISIGAVWNHLREAPTPPRQFTKIPSYHSLSVFFFVTFYQIVFWTKDKIYQTNARHPQIKSGKNSQQIPRQKYKNCHTNTTNISLKKITKASQKHLSETSSTHNVVWLF